MPQTLPTRGEQQEDKDVV